jgi:hypothetical protein
MSTPQLHYAPSTSIAYTVTLPWLSLLPSNSNLISDNRGTVQPAASRSWISNESLEGTRATPFVDVPFGRDVPLAPESSVADIDWVNAAGNRFAAAGSKGAGDVRPSGLAGRSVTIVRSSVDMVAAARGRGDVSGEMSTLEG